MEILKRKSSITIYNNYINNWLNGIENGMRGKTSISNHIRRYLFILNNISCELCSWNKINHITNRCPLEIHHKDGNHKNNKKENLQLLCPNCHSLTSTYKSLNNKGRTR